MKKLALVFLLLIVSMLVFQGCGQDGEDGKSYLAIDWVYMPAYYWDDNPSLPSIIYAGEFFKSKKGTYNFEYEAWDGSFYVGTYTIKVEEGEKGQSFPWPQDGADGDDKHYELWLYSFGPGLYVSQETVEKEETAAQASAQSASYSGTMNKASSPSVSGETATEPVIHIKEKKVGNTTFRLEYRKIAP